MPRVEYAYWPVNKPSMSTFVSNAINWLAKGSATVVVATHLNFQVIVKSFV